MKQAESRLIHLLAALALLLPAAKPLTAQDMLEVVRGQMATGHTADARVLVGSAVETAASPAQRNRALLYRAYLETDEDSASAGLELVSSAAEGQAEAVSARERLGDLAFSRGNYREALKNWLLAAETAGSLEHRQSSLVKAARAQLRMNRPQQALKTLEKGLGLGRSSNYGMLLYYTGKALQRTGNRKQSAEYFLAAYQSPGNPYQLAALSYLAEFYGKGKSRQAGQWRQRLAESAARTVFDPGEVSAAAGMPAELQGTYSIQLGAFSSRARAGTQAESLKKQGFKAVVLPAGSDGLYRVRIVGLPGRREAEKIIKRLKKKGISYHLISPGD